MAVSIEAVLLNFITSLIISGVIIYVVTKLLGKREGIGTALLTAFVGSIIYAIFYFFIDGLLASVLGGIVWLIALGTLYNMGWGKSLIVAIVIWVIAAFVGGLLPTLTGPL